jgi:hypothetical protein
MDLEYRKMGMGGYWDIEYWDIGIMDIRILGYRISDIGICKFALYLNIEQKNKEQRMMK